MASLAEETEEEKKKIQSSLSNHDHSLSISDDLYAEGKKFGDYVLGRTLGQGSFGKVKVATHINTKEVVAIKIVDKVGISDVEDVERVYRETFILTTLKHRNIIKLFEVFDTSKAIMLSMEYAGGGELYSHVLDRGRIDEVETCRLFHQIVSGVEYCHRAKIIHRDLKLENILLDENGTVKIADFGLSNTIKFGQKMGTNCGTPSYTSPDQIKGDDYVGSAADIWSLGVILFTMISGFLPFEADNIPSLFRKILNGFYTFPDYISEESQDLIKEMLQTDSQKRLTVPQIRNHPWFLMEYSDLIERLSALPAVSQETINQAHVDCLSQTNELLREFDKERERERDLSRSHSHHRSESKEYGRYHERPDTEGRERAHSHSRQASHPRSAGHTRSRSLFTHGSPGHLRDRRRRADINVKTASRAASPAVDKGPSRSSSRPPSGRSSTATPGIRKYSNPHPHQLRPASKTNSHSKILPVSEGKHSRRTDSQNSHRAFEPRLPRQAEEEDHIRFPPITGGGHDSKSSALSHSHFIPSLAPHSAIPSRDRTRGQKRHVRSYSSSHTASYRSDIAPAPLERPPSGGARTNGFSFKSPRSPPSFMAETSSSSRKSLKPAPPTAQPI